jgi:hypothetical protein
VKLSQYASLDVSTAKQDDDGGEALSTVGRWGWGGGGALMARWGGAIPFTVNNFCWLRLYAELTIDDCVNCFDPTSPPPLGSWLVAIDAGWPFPVEAEATQPMNRLRSFD